MTAQGKALRRHGGFWWGKKNAVARCRCVHNGMRWMIYWGNPYFNSMLSM